MIPYLYMYIVCNHMLILKQVYRSLSLKHIKKFPYYLLGFIRLFGWLRYFM